MAFLFFAEKFVVAELADTQSVEPGLSHKNHMGEIVKRNQLVEVAPFVVDKRSSVSINEVE